MEKAMRLFMPIIIAILVAVVMVVLSTIPPLSIVYEWAERNNLKFIWYGLIAGVIGLCLSLYRLKR